MLKIYNDLTRELEVFSTREPNKVYMYVCGLTPYDFAHAGHGRSAVVYDVMHRYFLYLGYDVIHISNFTDIDDKIIERSNELKVDYKELAEHFATIYLEDLNKLNVLKLYAYPRATEHIVDIIEIVKVLEEKGYAYEIDDGVYFDVSKFKDYGKLSHRNVSELQVGARIEVNPQKRNPLDFSLWKKAKEGEPSWDSPWGKGRPGWHIECSAMTLKYLGNSFDIHGGGDDLVFPHHENEIAQSEAYTGVAPFVRIWAHNGMLTVDREKMSKSTRNFFNLHTLLQDYDGEIVRLFFISASYKKPLNFDLEGLELARKNYEYLHNTYLSMKEYLNKDIEGSISISSQILRWKEEFLNAMDDDFNTPVAIAVLFDIFRFFNTNKDSIPTMELKELDDLLKDFFFILGFDRIGEERAIDTKFEEKLRGVLAELVEDNEVRELLSSKDLSSPTEILNALIDVRNEFRKRKRFEMSDRIRNALKSIGIVLEDTKDGTKYKLEATNG
ncbi:MAG: cysteine--tRNA ligase [Candidatus Atribacteria bacterium]|nr:cysteine--tRNA ligase [Candidatus Atribacteria bacterium]